MYESYGVYHACERTRHNLVFLNTLQILSHSHTAEANCHSRCVDQGIQYVRLSPKLNEEVDSGEIDNQKLLNMLWSTRVYMHSCREQVDSLTQYLKYRSMNS